MKKAFQTYLAILFLFCINNNVLANDHNNCKNSKWGADDEIGAANYMNEKSVMLASKLVKKGKTYPLGIVINSKTPAFPPRSLSLTVLSPNQYNSANLSGAFGYHMNYVDDILNTWVGIGSQIDGLGHLGENDMLYNCNKAGEVAKVTGLTKMGVHNIPPMVARGIVINMAKHFGVQTMEAGQAIFAKDLEVAMRDQGITPQEGDVILIHTGWTSGKFETDPKAWGSAEPGTSNDAMEYLMQFNPMAVGADTWGVDVVPPAEGDKVFYGHVIALQNNGVYLLEVMDTAGLVKNQVKEFMFVLGQARIEGTVQMIINPVAIW